MNLSLDERIVVEVDGVETLKKSTYVNLNEKLPLITFPCHWLIKIKTHRKLMQHLFEALSSQFNPYDPSIIEEFGILLLGSDFSYILTTRT